MAIHLVVDTKGLPKPKFAKARREALTEIGEIAVVVGRSKSISQRIAGVLDAKIGYKKMTLVGYDAFFFWRFIEGGTKPHMIPKRGGRRRIMRIGGSMVAGPVRHPGMTEHPFLAPSIHEPAGEYAGTILDAIQRNVL